MAPSKKPSAARINLPNHYKPKKFTIRQLAKRWKEWDYDKDDIEDFIEDKELKPAFDTVELGANLDDSYYTFRDINFYKHYVGDGEGLKIYGKNTLEELVGSVAKDNLIPCSEIDFLYLPEEVSVRKIRKREESDYLIPFFCDAYGNQLIPTHDHHSLLIVEPGHPILPLPIDKHLFDELLIIPLEEVERFEKEIILLLRSSGKNEGPYSVKTSEDIMKKVRNEIKFNREEYLRWEQPKQEKKKDEAKEIYFEHLATRVERYEKLNNLQKRPWAEIRDELVKNKKQETRFLNTWRKLLKGEIKDRYEKVPLKTI